MKREQRVKKQCRVSDGKSPARMREKKENLHKRRKKKSEACGRLVVGIRDMEKHNAKIKPNGFGTKTSQ